jgi:hypothetical protein
MKQSYAKYFEEIDVLIKRAGGDQSLKDLIIKTLEKDREERVGFIEECDKRINMLKGKVSIKEFVKPNPALIQLEADAKEFDRQHDCEEIRAKDIPF